MTPQPEQIKQAIDTAAGDEALDQLAKLVWFGLAENALDEADAAHLVHQIAARRRVETTGSIRPIRAFERGPKTVGNVLTNSLPGDPPKAFNHQCLSGDGDGVSGAGLTSRVKQNDQNEGRAGGLSSSPERGGAKPSTAPPAPRKLSDHADQDRRRCRKKKPRKRGPRSTKYLTTDQVREIDQAIHTLRSAGKSLNRMMTINAPQGVPDAQGKRLISRKLGHIGQDLKRAGHEHIHVDVYEKHGASGRVHVHSLVHAPRGFEHLIEKHDEGDCGDVCVSRADHRAAAYVTKQRRFGQPAFERANKRPWRPCAEIPGKRFSISPAARAIIEAADQTKARTPPPDPIDRRLAAAAAPPPMIEMQAAPAQLRLFADDDLPEVRADADLPDAIRAVRTDAGITQTALAERIGVRQAHLANVERHHDRLGRATRRAARYLLQRIAA